MTDSQLQELVRTIWSAALVIGACVFGATATGIGNLLMSVALIGFAWAMQADAQRIGEKRT